MKKIILSLIASALAINLSFAQATNTFPTTGNAGLGTTSPPTYSSYGVLALNGSSPFQGGYLSLMTNGTEVGALVANSQLNIATASGLITQFSTGGSPTMQISSSGNVGVGTTSPFAKVSIVTTGSGNPLSFQANSAGAWTVGPNVGSTSGDDTFGVYSYTYGSGHSSAPLIQFNSSTGNTFINQGSGNVLIGRTTQNNSAYKLDVDGYMHADKVVVNVGGADFVFAPTYKLNSLANVEKYIKANRHLPEIQSAREMEANGLSLGDNQIKLLQKIEELTLYLIQKDKEVKEFKQSQQKEIATLKKQQQRQINVLSAKLDAVLKAQPNKAK